MIGQHSNKDSSRENQYIIIQSKKRKQVINSYCSVTKEYTGGLIPPPQSL